MKSIQPGKQRKRMYNAPLHKQRKMLASHLEENLLLKYDRRSLPVIKGDTIRVMRGSFKGHEDKVAKVHVKKGFIEIEGLIMSKADGNKIAKPIQPSNVLITKLNLTDKWRRQKIEKGLSEETRKEIEKEAEEQIKEAEIEEQKKLEEEQKQKELEEAEKTKAEETTEEIDEDKTEKKEETEKEKTKEEKKTTTKKPAEKKVTTTKKKTTTSSAKKTTKKKTSTKKKKEE